LAIVTLEAATVHLQLIVFWGLAKVRKIKRIDFFEGFWAVVYRKFISWVFVC
jgi:hypothetical protein